MKNSELYGSCEGSPSGMHEFEGMANPLCQHCKWDYRSIAHVRLQQITSSLKASRFNREQAEAQLEAAKQREAALVDCLQGFVDLLDGRTEPLHPISWIVDLDRAKAILLPKSKRQQPSIDPRVETQGDTNIEAPPEKGD